MRGSSTGSAARAPGCTERVRGAREHAAGDAADAEAGHVIEPVGRAIDDRRRRAQAAADRRTYALAQVAGRQSRGIPGDEGVVAPHDLDLAAQIVAVAGRIVVRAAGESAAQALGEPRPVLLDPRAVASHARSDRADADVQPAVLLGHVPGIARQFVLAEPQVAVRVLPVVLDLVLERHDLQLVRARVRLAEQVAVHRAARAAGADQVTAAIRAVDDVA